MFAIVGIVFLVLVGCAHSTAERGVSQTGTMPVFARMPARFLGRDECFPKGKNSFDAILVSSERFPQGCAGSFRAELKNTILVQSNSAHDSDEIKTTIETSAGRCVLHNWVGSTSLTADDFRRGIAMTPGSPIQIGVMLAGNDQAAARWSTARIYMVHGSGLQNLLECQKRKGGTYVPAENIDAAFLESVLPIKIGRLTHAEGGDVDAP